MDKKYSSFLQERKSLLCQYRNCDVQWVKKRVIHADKKIPDAAAGVVQLLSSCAC